MFLEHEVTKPIISDSRVGFEVVGANAELPLGVSGAVSIVSA